MRFQRLDLHLASKVSDMKYAKTSINRLPRNVYTLNEKKSDKICNVLSVTFCTYITVSVLRLAQVEQFCLGIIATISALTVF